MGFQALPRPLGLIILQSTVAPTPRVREASSQNAIPQGRIERPAEHEHECSQSSQTTHLASSSQSSQTTEGSQNRRVRRTGTGGGAWNAPIAYFMMTETSGQTYGFGTKTEEERYCRLAQEARKWVLGPMPPRDFLDAFLEQEDEWACLGEMPASEGAFKDVPRAAKLEQGIYEPLVGELLFQSCELCASRPAGESHKPRTVSRLHLLHHFRGCGQQRTPGFDGKLQTGPLLLCK